MKKIISVIGARPQFIKHAPMQLELQKRLNALTIHTGQHYDENMSMVFFNELNIPLPTYSLNLEVGLPHGAQTAAMMVDLENIMTAEKPHAVLVYGDTNSTLAASLVASKMYIPIIHIEAGLRSYNRLMPEEINRIITDQLSWMLFCPSDAAIHNLAKEGILHPHIYRNGDVMCDMLRLVESHCTEPIETSYYFATLHRPYNTDNSERFKRLLEVLNNLNKKVVFPIHPRTSARMKQYGLDESHYPQIIFKAPIGYLESISYQKYSDGVITDSGGMQKEAYMLAKKCITIRSETEWVETLQGGWNNLVFEDLNKLQTLLNSPSYEYNETMYGNGKAAKEIAETIAQCL